MLKEILTRWVSCLYHETFNVSEIKIKKSIVKNNSPL